MIKLPLRLVPPTTENRTVTPTRRPNADYRTREHLTQAEVERLIKAAGKNRWGHRDATMVLVAFLIRGRAPEYSAHGEIHRASADPLSRLLPVTAMQYLDRHAP